MFDSGIVKCDTGTVMFGKGIVMYDTGIVKYGKGRGMYDISTLIYGTGIYSKISSYVTYLISFLVEILTSTVYS